MRMPSWRSQLTLTVDDFYWIAVCSTALGSRLLHTVPTPYCINSIHAECRGATKRITTRTLCVNWQMERRSQELARQYLRLAISLNYFPTDDGVLLIRSPEGLYGLPTATAALQNRFEDLSRNLHEAASAICLVFNVQSTAETVGEWSTAEAVYC